MNPGRYSVVLWDLDGTLVGLRRRMFAGLMPVVAASVFRDLVPPSRFLRELPKVVGAVRVNRGAHTNFELMAHKFDEHMGIDPAVARARLERLTEVGMPRLRRCFYRLPEAVDLVARLEEAGKRQVVATNPLWPLRSAHQRLGWGGHRPETFAFITSGESMRRAKPSVEFYRELLDRLAIDPADCVMIGNEPKNDSPAAALGIPVFLVGVSKAQVTQDYSHRALVRAGDWRQLRDWLGLEEESCSSS